MISILFVAKDLKKNHRVFELASSANNGNTFAFKDKTFIPETLKPLLQFLSGNVIKGIAPSFYSVNVLEF